MTGAPNRHKVNFVLDETDTTVSQLCTGRLPTFDAPAQQSFPSQSPAPRLHRSRCSDHDGTRSLTPHRRPLEIPFR